MYQFHGTISFFSFQKAKAISLCVIYLITVRRFQQMPKWPPCWRWSVAGLSLTIPRLALRTVNSSEELRKSVTFPPFCSYQNVAVPHAKIPLWPPWISSSSSKIQLRHSEKKMSLGSRQSRWSEIKAAKSCKVQPRLWRICITWCASRGCVGFFFFARNCHLPCCRCGCGRRSRSGGGGGWGRELAIIFCSKHDSP